MSDLSVNGGAAIPNDSEHPDIHATSGPVKQPTSALPTNARLEGLVHLSKLRQSSGDGDASDSDDLLETLHRRMVDSMPLDVEGGLREILDKPPQQDDNNGA